MSCLLSEIRRGCIQRVIQREGGYSHDPDDSGGATHWGITETVAREQGYTGDMATLTYDQAEAIYENLYWHRLNLDNVYILSPKLTEILFDTGVNQGTRRAAEYLQRCLNVLNQQGQLYPDLTLDGVIGDHTLAALEAYLDHRGAEGNTVLNTMINCLKGAFYVELAERRQKDEKFIYGWMKNRVVSC